MSVYRVTGRWRYREHAPGETFEATLEPDAERRAVTHGVIEVIEHSHPGIRPGSYFLPRGWETRQPQTQEA